MAIPKGVEHTPKRLKQTLRWLPKPLIYGGITLLFGRIFKTDCERGSFDFLIGKKVFITISDIDLQFQVSATHCYQRTFLNVTPITKEADVSMRVTWSALLQLTTQKVDPDTLFFKRKLLLTGDTELGLQIKNLLDTIELEQRLPAAVHQQLCKLANKSMIEVN